MADPRCPAWREHPHKVLLLLTVWEPTRCVRPAGHRGRHRNWFGDVWRQKVKTEAKHV